MASRWLSGEESSCQSRRRGVDPGSGRSPGEGNGYPLQYLPGKSHRQRSLEGYSPWGQNESDTTKQLNNNKTPVLGLPLLKTSLAKEVMLKILQARLQQYVNRELPDVQAGFRKGKRDQIANICWIMEKARQFQKNIYFCFIDYAKAFDCVDHSKLENSSRDGNTTQLHSSHTLVK